MMEIRLMVMDVVQDVRLKRVEMELFILERRVKIMISVGKDLLV